MTRIRVRDPGEPDLGRSPACGCSVDHRCNQHLAQMSVARRDAWLAEHPADDVSPTRSGWTR